MRKVCLIGDCHAARVNEHHEKSEIDFDFDIWGFAGLKAYSLDLNTLFEEDTPCSGIEIGIKPGDHPERDDKKIIGFKKIAKHDIVMLWLGYVDVRTFLPRYLNTEEVVKDYVNQVVKFYKNSYIQFIEPLPQFTELNLKFEGISPFFSYEERKEQDVLFNHYLNEYTQYLGLPKPITQNELLEAMGVAELNMSHIRIHPSLPHPTDGLATEYSGKLYDFFIDRIRPLT